MPVPHSTETLAHADFMPCRYVPCLAQALKRGVAWQEKILLRKHRPSRPGRESWHSMMSRHHELAVSRLIPFLFTRMRHAKRFNNPA
jgi:hypothetical protein